MQEHSKDGASTLAGPIERALAAHRHILSSLEAALGAKKETEKPTSHPPHNPDEPPAKDANWVESPWKYLNIPSKDRGRLGPMPRFVPVPSPKKSD